MSNPHLKDWKDEANAYFDKCIALILIFMMFLILVFPTIESKVIRSVEKVMETVEIPEEILEKIEQQEITIPQIIYEIIDEDDANDDDVKLLTTIGTTTDIITEIIPDTSNKIGSTPPVTVYDIPPVVTGRISPEYPDQYKRMGIQGSVVLLIEVFGDGEIGMIRVERSDDKALEEECIKAVRKWVIQPALFDGVGVASWLRQPFDFSVK